MILTGNEDLRIRKTIEAIHNAFKDMLLEMPYEKITVKALCARAVINKKTFYRYYPTLDELLMELQSQFAIPYVEQTTGMRYPDDVEAITRDFLAYSAAQGELYDRIVCSSTHTHILQRVIEQMEDDRYFFSRAPEGWSREEWSLYMAHVTSAQLRIYRQWVEDGRRVPVERMIEIGCKLICSGARL